MISCVSDERQAMYFDGSVGCGIFSPLIFPAHSETTEDERRIGEKRNRWFMDLYLPMTLEERRSVLATLSLPFRFGNRIDAFYGSYNRHYNSHHHDSCNRHSDSWNNRLNRKDGSFHYLNRKRG